MVARQKRIRALTKVATFRIPSTLREIDSGESSILGPVLYEGKVLDGRRRNRTCRGLGIKPESRLYTGLGRLQLRGIVHPPVGQLDHRLELVLARQPHLEAGRAHRQVEERPEGSLPHRGQPPGSQSPHSARSTSVT